MLSRKESRIQPLLEEDEEDEEMDPLQHLEQSTDTLPVVESVRLRQQLIRRSSSAVERVAMPATPEELEDGGDKSLRPRFLQERSATTVHIAPQVVAEPTRVPRSKASAFLLDVLAKSRGNVTVDNRRSPLEPLRAGVTNTVHYVPLHGGERGAPLRKAAKNRRKLSTNTSSDLEGSEKLDRTRERRVSASQEQMSAVVRALQASKQQMQEQQDILHSILRYINSSTRDGKGKRPVLQEMVDLGIIPELASTMREFRFHTGLQIGVMTILSALAEESALYAYMMSECNLEKLLQKTITVHATQDRVVMLASSLVRAIEDSKHTVNIAAYQAEKAANASQQSATYTDTVVAAITAKSRQTLSSPSPIAKSFRSLNSASSHEKRGLGSERTDLRYSAGRQRSAFSLDVAPPALRSNYGLLIPQKLVKAGALSLAVGHDKNKFGNQHDKCDRPLTSSTRKPLSLDLTSRSLATAIYSGRAIFVEPSPLSKRSSFRGSFSAGGVRRKLRVSKNIQRAHTERLPPTQILRNESSAPGKPKKSRTNSMEIDDDDSAANNTKEREDETYDEKSQDREENGINEDGKEEEDESYEDDFDTTGDDGDEDKTLPSRRDSSQLACDGELIDMLTEINAATTIQRQVRGLLVRRECVRKTNASRNTGKPNMRSARGVKSGRCDAKTKGTKAKRMSLSARQCQHQGSRKRESFQSGTGCRPVIRVRPATAMSPANKQLLKAKQGSESESIGAKQLSANAIKSPERPSQLGGFSIVSTSSNEVEPEQTAEDDVEVVKEPADPESLKQIQTLYAEGLQHHKENHLGLAIDCYEKALALPGGHNFASLYVNLGSALMAQNKVSEALESFKQAKHIQPNNVKAIFNYSVALLHLGRPKEAQHQLRRILELDPTHEKAIIALSHYYSPITHSR
ncbi:hypothetical protein PInf_014348 [Phytophthora infestans]|nr:hypothetical protein PInf_014348 [Phytophthora infestans]